jgi:translation initiation factor IF-3
VEKKSGETPATQPEPKRGGSGRPPRRRRTAIGYSDGDKDKEVRLLDEDGTQLGIVPTKDALMIAREKGLELFLVQPDANPPVARLMDYGRFKFELGKKARETKQRTHVLDLKEIKMRYKIGDNDYQIKLRHAIEFLQDGDRVKVLTILHGREMEHKVLATALMQKFASELKELAVIDREPKVEGKSVIMILSPAPQRQPH